MVSLARRSNVRAILPSLMLTVTQFLWFLLPAGIELISGKEVPQTRYSSGLLAVLHSTQYLWITSYYQKREALAAGNADWRFSRYLLTLVAGGIALFIPRPWIASRLFHADFAASFLTFTAQQQLAGQEARSPENTTPTTIEQFVADELVPRFQGKSAGA